MKTQPIACLLVSVLAACDPSSSEDASGAGEPECTGEAPNWYRVELVGSGFSSYDGVTIHTMTGIGLARGGTCRSATSTEIDDGAFEVENIGRTDDAVYPTVAAFIDIDGDERCRPTVDPAWWQYE